MEPTLEAIHKNFVCKIGKRNGNMVNMITNFNPIDQWIFIPALKMTDGIVRIANLSDYGNGTGGLAIELDSDRNEQFLRDVTEKCMNLLMY
jgi:hypothetical protein